MTPPAMDTAATDTAATDPIATDPILALRPTTGRPALGARSGHLFHPVVDFLCLGGGSLIALAAISLLLDVESARAPMMAAGIAIAHVINHPHFAHSYQIFYRNFREKAFGSGYPAPLRRLYLLSGVIVPIVLALFLAIAIATKQLALLGLAFNAMAFFVGWHYVKQGYGMIVLDSVLKRRFFTEREKKLLLVNAYVVWATTWLSTNADGESGIYWGIPYTRFDLPDWTFPASAAVAVVTGIATLLAFARRAAPSGPGIAWNGVVAYLVTLYAWMIFARLNPLFLLIIPAFHSLQYLVVVWRYQLNLAGAGSGDARAATGRSPLLSLAGFFLVAMALGFLAFWGLPGVLDATVPYDRSLFPGTLFVFAFWIFINVHHYFLDTVMWRKGNPDVARHLFGR